MRARRRQLAVVIPISDGLRSLSEVLAAIVVDPRVSSSTASSAGTNAGAGGDSIVAAGRNLASAAASSVRAADFEITDRDVSDIGERIDVSIGTAALMIAVDGAGGTGALVSDSTTLSDASTADSTCRAHYSGSRTIDVGTTSGATTTTKECPTGGFDRRPPRRAGQRRSGRRGGLCPRPQCAVTGLPKAPQRREYRDRTLSARLAPTFRGTRGRPAVRVAA